MNGLTSAELSRKAHVSRSAITQARSKGIILQDQDGTFDPNNPDIALYIQRGVERNQYRIDRSIEPLSETLHYPQMKPNEQRKIISKKKPSKESIFVDCVITVLNDIVGKEKQKKIMLKIFEKYSKDLS